MKDEVMSKVDGLIKLLGHSEALKVSSAMVDWMWGLDVFTEEEEGLFIIWNKISTELSTRT
tara:strand:- start:101 stop:283 length:183 start_codon:yes stop_codon:yes gene_type:complete